MKEAWKQSKLGWVLLVILFSVAYIGFSGSDLLRSQFGVLAWKMILVSVALAFAHLTRKQIFPYVDLSEVAKNDDSRSGLMFLSLAAYYIGIVFAVCSGL